MTTNITVKDIIKKEIDLDKHQNIYDKPKIEKQLRIEDYGIEYANNYWFR